MPTETFSLFDLAPGKVIAGRFRIVKPQRQSGLSSTFEAADEQAADAAAKRCALNVFPGALFEGVKQADEFRESWLPWLAVRSSHVISLREVLALPQQTTILVTEFPDGQTLRDWMKEQGGHVDPSRAVELGRQLLDGLAAIHAQGLVHGDIKPQTIFVAPGKGKNGLRGLLVDGGITLGLWNAKHLGEHTALIGTPYYAPVEQFGGEAPDVLSDIYNVATVLFELVTGVLPWPGASMLEVFQQKLDKQAPSMKKRAPKVEVAPELESAIVHGLMADKRKRFQSAAAFRDALATAAAV
jgi:serine/threonine-protein kinase